MVSWFHGPVDRFLAIGQLKVGFWLLAIATILTAFSFFTNSLTMMVYFTTVADISPTFAAIFYSIESICGGLSGVLVGFLFDSPKTRVPVLVAATLLSTFGRLLAAALPRVDYVIYITYPFMIAAGDVALAVILSSTASAYLPPGIVRKAGLGVLYSMQNVAAYLLGHLYDWFVMTRQLPETVPFTDWPLINPSLQWLVALSSAPALLGGAIGIVAYLRMKHDYPVLESKESVEAERRGEAACMQCGTLAASSLWRFLALSLILVNIGALYRHMDTTIPTFMRRIYGPYAPVGTLYSVNPTIVIPLTIAMPILLANFSPMHLILAGTWLSALCPLFLAGSTPDALGLAGVAVAYAILSVGEALSGPQFREYMADVAGPERIGMFTAASSVLGFWSKLFVGFEFAWLSSTYCPEDPALGACQARTLWFIVAGITATSPVLLSVLFRVLYETSVRLKYEVRLALNLPEDALTLYDPGAIQMDDIVALDEEEEEEEAVHKEEIEQI